MMFGGGFGQARRGWRWDTDCKKIGDVCKRCLCEADPQTCREIGACAGGSSGREHMRGYNPGLSGITDTIADAAGAVTKCPVPFLIGIGVGYLIKKSGMLKKITL